MDGWICGRIGVDGFNFEPERANNTSHLREVDGRHCQADRILGRILFCLKFVVRCFSHSLYGAEL